MPDLNDYSSWTLGDRLRFARNARGLTQGDISRLGGPSRITISRIEQGVGLTGRTYLATIEAIAASLRCTTTWLKDGVPPVWQSGEEPPAPGKQRVLPRPTPIGNPSRTGPSHFLGLGTHTSQGPIDWTIVSHATTEFDRYISSRDDDDSARHAKGVNKPFALQILYNYLAQQDDPLKPIEIRDLQTLVRAALVR